MNKLNNNLLIHENRNHIRQTIKKALNELFRFQILKFFMNLGILYVLYYNLYPALSHALTTTTKKKLQMLIMHPL